MGKIFRIKDITTVDKESYSDERNEGVFSTDSASEESPKTKLPQPLLAQQMKMYFGAVLSTVAIFVLLVITKEIQVALLLLLSIWLAYQGFCIDKDWNKNEIIEKLALCSVVNYNPLKKELTVGFLSTEDESSFYTMTIPGGKKREKEFLVGCCYIIYYREHNPKYLVAYSTQHIS